MNKTFDSIIETRRAIHVFDPEKAVDSEIVKNCLQKAQLAPTSNNMQLWEVYHVIDKKKLAELSAICLSQRPATTAKEIVVFVCRFDKWKQRALFNLEQIQKTNPDNLYELKYYKKTIPLIFQVGFLDILGKLKKIIQIINSFYKPSFIELTKNDHRIVINKSCALAAQTFMLALTEANLDSCPMEGYDSRRLKKYLNLPKQAEICMAIAIGIREDKKLSARIRVPFDEIYFKI